MNLYTRRDAPCLQQQMGFTLIELLIAVTMLSLVIVTTYASFNIGVKTYKKIEHENYINQCLRQSVRVLSRDMRCAYKGNYESQNANNDKNDHNSYLFSGSNIQKNNRECDIVEFTTYPQDGPIQTVKFFIDNDNETPYEGLIKESRLLYSDPDDKKAVKKQEIAPLACSLNLKYFDGINWKDSWQQKTGFPKSIEIEIEVLDNENVKTIKTTVPVMAGL